MAQTALDDVVVIELATGVAGPYAGRLLADLGAQVIKVEPGASDPIRLQEPLVDGESAFFAYLNAGKLSVDLELSDPRLDDLVRQADIVLHSLPAGPAADDLDRRLKAANPGAVIVSTTPYGRTGERSTWKASPLTEWATSGYHYIAGEPGREPLALPGFQAEFHAGLHAAGGALAGLWASRESGVGQVVEVSHQEATLSDHAWLTTMWSHEGKIQSRTGSLFVPCADGFIFLFNLVPYPNLFILMERFDMLEDEELLMPLNYMGRFTTDVLPVFAEWAATRTKQEIYHACQELRIAASPVNDMKDVAENPQLFAREWCSTLSVGGREVRAPGVPYKITGTPCTQANATRRHGADTDSVLSPAFEWANAGVVRGSKPISPDGPLTGLRVIEVTANWAGPIGGRHLGDLGADVIKVELATKPATRSLVWIPEDLWPDHYNRSAYFNKLNRNKRDVCLDLSTEEGKRIFLKLVEKSDVVLENNAARVMPNLGLDFESLARVNPGIIMCSMAGFGGTGPERNYSAYGSNIETASGLASLLGYDSSKFFGTGTFYADPVTGNHGTVAMLAALHARRKSGRGQWIDMSLLEAVTPFFSQQLFEYSVTGNVPGPKGNNSWGNMLEGVVPTAGVDCWLAYTVSTEDQLRTLNDITGGAGDASEALRAWAATVDHNTAAATLQAAGITAAPVMKNWEILWDNHLNDRDFFVRMRHAVMGTLPYPGWPWRFETTPARLRMAGPLFAEHNDEVFREVAGLSDQEIADLYATGVSAKEPAFSGGL